MSILNQFYPQRFISRLSAMIMVAALVISISRVVSAQTNVTANLSKSLGDVVVQDTKGWVRRDDPAMTKWRDDRFGIMIHWGIYSVAGGWWNGKEVKGAAEWIKAFAHVSNADYDQLVGQFNPTNYDPVAWAKLFKATGAKYVVITTKHHDGFCLWDSKFTDFDIAATPYKKDLLKPLAEALRAEGIDVGLYYSIIDWHNPDYRASLKTPEDKIAYARYLVYLKNQVKELLTEFGPVTTIWFDGRWDSSYKSNPQTGKDLETYCRSLSPGIVIGDRVRAYDAMADYNSGYERKLPVTQPLTDWECCMTMTENAWGYHRTWSGNGWKTPGDICELLTRCAAMNGNFLINIGPKPDGSIRSEEVMRLDRVGAWMKINSDAIYGTEAFPIKDLPAGIYATRKGNHVYLIVFSWPDTDKLKLTGVVLKSASLLTAGGAKSIAMEGGNTLAGLPMESPDSIAAVFALELKGND